MRFEKRVLEFGKNLRVTVQVKVGEGEDTVEFRPRAPEVVDKVLRIEYDNNVGRAIGTTALYEPISKTVDLGEQLRLLFALKDEVKTLKAENAKLKKTVG